MPKISKTWIIIGIGTKEYAVNHAYVTSIGELKPEQFVVESSLSFVKGIYKIYDLAIPVIDGYKMSNQNSLDDKKIAIAKRFNDFKVAYMEMIELAEWQVMSWDKDRDAQYLELIGRVTNMANSLDCSNDPYADKLMKRIKEHMLMNISRFNGLVNANRDGSIDASRILAEIEQIKKSSNRHVLDNLDNIRDFYTSRITEMCIVFHANEKDFGVSIDNIKIITEEIDELNHTKKTSISAGVVVINKQEYNVLDLTKLSKAVG